MNQFERSLTRNIGPMPRSASAGVLDGLPAPIVAIALRRVRQWWDGPLIRVRRSSDNAERSIGAASGNQTRQNLNPNPTLSGAGVGTPGTYPTGWTGSQSQFGCAINVVATGTDSLTGLPFVDIRIVGTSTGGQVRITMLQPQSHSAGVRGCWSVGYQLIAGALTNLGTPLFNILYRDAGNAVVGQFPVWYIPSSTSRRHGHSAVAPANTTNVLVDALFNTTAGPIDATIRYIAPNWETGVTINARPLLTTNVTTVASAGDLDLDALDAFVPSNANANITIGFDQSGCGLNGTQASAVVQPFIVSTGAVDTINGRPAPRLYGSQWLAVTLSPDRTAYPQFSVSVVAHSPVRSGDNAMWGADDGGWDRLQLLNFPANTAVNYGIGAGTIAINQPALATTSPFVYLARMNVGVANDSNVWTNGVAGVAYTEAVGSAHFQLGIGALNRNGSFAMVGSIGEFFAFPALLTDAERIALQANQGAYYGIAV